MPRRAATLLLVLAIALSGLASASCANALCAQMRCCPIEGLHAPRNCCGASVAPAAPAGTAALERAPQTPPLTALPAVALPPAMRVANHAVAVVPSRGVGPPASLLRQHTSLLI